MIDDAPPTFTDLLRRARRAAGLTQEALAEAAGVSARVVSDLERGVIRAPRRDTLDLLADALCLAADERKHWEQVRRRLAMRSAAPSSIGTPSAKGSLPTPLTPFVGRQREVEDVVCLLRRPGIRLVTVLGPGGIGKTRFAIAVGRRMLDHYPHGAWFVNLAPLSDPDLVLTTVAATLDVALPGSQTALAALIAALRTQHVLLVVDNVEQVVAAAPALAELLSACPALSLLATSRVPLHIHGEHEYPLAPLRVPDPRGSMDVTEVMEADAVVLFRQQAEAVKPDFQVTANNARVIAEICRRLDGLPLAIELAAVRIKLLPPPLLLDRLDRRLSLLVGGGRDAPARQQTLRATMQWSYDLLTPEEQTVFRRLSVFRGGWTLEAAEAVAGDERSDVLTALEGLIDHSLVRVREQPDGTPRFSMLETIREFGLEQLTHADELAVVRQRHANYVLQFAKHGEHYLWWRPAETMAWLDRFEIEHDNARAALRWAEETDNVALALQIAGVFWILWSDRGYLTEGRDWIEPLLAGNDRAPDALRMQPLLGAGLMATWQGDFGLAETRLEESLRLAHAAGDRLVVGSANTFLGILASVRPERDVAQAQLRFEEALSISRELGLYRGISVSLNNLAAIAKGQGDYDRAMALLLEGLHVAREQRDMYVMNTALGSLGWMALERNDYPRALECYREALGLDPGGRLMRNIVSVEGIAKALLATGHVERAVRLLSAVRMVRERVGLVMTRDEAGEFDGTVASARAHLGEGAFMAAWQAGEDMTVDEVIEDATATTSS